MDEARQIDMDEQLAKQRSTFLGGRVTLYAGDCLSVLAALPENSVDSVVCDPPYHLTSIVKRFGGANAAPAKAGKTGAYARASAGFMGKQWDGGDISFRAETWELVYRVLKPGGHLIAFSGTRTYHRMACAIEDAGFEVRDMIPWHYGSGFPKSHNVSKNIDKVAGAAREVIRERYTAKRIKPGATVVAEGGYGKQDVTFTAVDTLPATDAAKQWVGWGTALKPATEPMCLARKPLEGTVIENVLKWGVGALNIDGCRIEPSARPARALDPKPTDSNVYSGRTGDGGLGKGLDGWSKAIGTTNVGRWPANLMHDGSPEVVAMFPQSDGQQADAKTSGERKTSNVFGKMNYSNGRRGEPSASKLYTDNGSVNFAALPGQRRGDSGSAARFFWSSKAGADDRLGSKHPTVKPIDLMRELVRLVTPKGGTVLDPFAGTGTTGEAAWCEGMKAILIEREPEYQADIARRMELVTRPTKRQVVAKSKNKLEQPEDLPFFRK